MFSRENRLSRSRDIQRVMRRGVSFSTPLFLIRYARSREEKPRFSFIVSNKISKKAVIRNTIKRRLREVVRKKKDLFPAGTDYCFVARAPSVQADSQAFVREVDEALGRLSRNTRYEVHHSAHRALPKNPLS